MFWPSNETYPVYNWYKLVTSLFIELQITHIVFIEPNKIKRFWSTNKLVGFTKFNISNFKLLGGNLTMDIAMTMSKRGFATLYTPITALNVKT